MVNPPETSFWRKCTTCKRPIEFKRPYWVCSVSTCNRARTGLVFCSVTCFDAHIPVMNHRDAGAFEKRAPSREEAAAAAAAPVPTPATPAPMPAPSAPRSETTPILVVVSKVKDYIRQRSGMNTSDSVMEVLSRHVTRWADEGIRSATINGRKTVLDRDVM